MMIAGRCSSSLQPDQACFGFFLRSAGSCYLLRLWELRFICARFFVVSYSELNKFLPADFHMSVRMKKTAGKKKKHKINGSLLQPSKPRPRGVILFLSEDPITGVNISVSTVCCDQHVLNETQEKCG